MTALVRTKGGRAAHRSTCSYAGAFPARWEWAEARSREEVEAASAALGIRMCQRCSPLTALPSRLAAEASITVDTIPEEKS